MRYRDIPKEIFDSVIVSDTCRAYDPPDKNIPVVSMTARLKGNLGEARYTSNDVQPKFATAYLGIFLNPRMNKRNHKPDPPLIMDFSMQKAAWAKGKGGLYLGRFRIQLGLDLTYVPAAFARFACQLMLRAAALQRTATQERFWEIEMYPDRDYTSRRAASEDE